MELRYLEIFCKVVECKSFSKAADALSLTQPTVSIHIRSLEDELSTRLLDRFGRKVLPTGPGEVLYTYAKRIVEARDEAKEALDQMSGRMRGTLLMGASTIPGEYIVPGYLSRFKALHPEVYPSLKIGDTKGICASVLEGAVDIGVIGAEVKDRSLAATRFLEDELVLVAPPDFKMDQVTRKGLERVPLLKREAGSGSRTSLEEALKRNCIDIEKLGFAGEFGSTQAIIQAVRSGMGLAFISRFAASDAIRQSLLKEVRVPGLRIKRHFNIITHRLKENSPVCKAFTDFLLKKEK